MLWVFKNLLQFHRVLKVFLAVNLYQAVLFLKVLFLVCEVQLEWRHDVRHCDLIVSLAPAQNFTHLYPPIFVELLVFNFRRCEHVRDIHLQVLYCNGLVV